MRLLIEVARDMGARIKAAGDIYVPDTYQAAQKVLSMLRAGKLGPVCFDAHPPQLERRRRQAKGLPVAAATPRRTAREIALERGVISEPKRHES